MRKVVFLAVLAATLLPAATASADSAAEQRMAQQIGGHIKQSGQLEDYRIGVKYHEGVAYLTGAITSQEQRDIAMKLASQVDGVSKVVSKLEFPMEAKEPASNDRHELADALDRATLAAAVNESPGRVVQAYGDTGGTPAASQRPPMMRNNNPRMNRQPMRRSNMPMPAQRMPAMMPIRQTGATGVYQAGGGCAGCNGGAMMGPGMGGPGGGPGMGPAPMGFVPAGSGRGPSYDNAQMPGYAWPSYASYPNYAALTYPQQYSPTAWPYIGPFYPYPQVPLAWRKVSLEWDDGWWFLDFSAHNSSH